MATMKNEEFKKSLERLAGMAKSQLHHTDSDSNPGAWPGGTHKDLDENGSDVSIDEGGTDYTGVRKSLAEKVRKSQALTPAEVAIAEGRNPLGLIGDKVSKGNSLTPAENWAWSTKYVGNISKASTKPMDSAPMSGEDDSAASAPKTHGGSMEEDVEGDAKKSFNSAVEGSLELQKGMEISPFLYELTRAIGSAVGSSEEAVKSLAKSVAALASEVAEIKKSAAASSDEQAEFNKSLATAVVGIGEALSATADATVASAQLPVGAPKSQMRDVSVISKSQESSSLTKGQVSEAMFELSKGGEIKSLDLIKFESTGQLDPHVRQKVENYYKTRN